MSGGGSDTGVGSRPHAVVGSGPYAGVGGSVADTCFTGGFGVFQCGFGGFGPV